MSKPKVLLKAPLRGTGTFKGGIVISGEFTLGSSGAIASVAGFLPLATTAGDFGIIKTAGKTARYTLTFDRVYKKIRPLDAQIIGPTDAGFGNTNANAVGFRNRNQGSAASTSGFDLQLMLASTGVDTDGASGYIITWHAFAEEM